MTTDVDVLTPIPQEIKSAFEQFAHDKGLHAEWLNNRVITIKDILPPGWAVTENTVTVFQGKAIIVRSLPVATLVKTKLFAAADLFGHEGFMVHLSDLKSFKLTRKEFEEPRTYVTRKELAEVHQKDKRGAKKRASELESILDAIKTVLFAP